MQPRFTVGVLVLQAERLVRRSRYVRLVFQTTPAVIIPKPQEVAVLIGHLTRDADVVAVEVVHFLTAFAFGTGVIGAPVPTVRSCRDRCRYRYICRLSGFPARGGCRPKRSRFCLFR